MAQTSEPAHAGEELRLLRGDAGMTIDEVAARANVDPGWLAGIEAGVGTHEVLYSQWVELVKATQPPRPEWWDEGYEHDLSLPPGGHHEPTTASGRLYWDRILGVRAEIERHYQLGRAGAR